MGLRDRYDFDILVNAAEQLVINELERQLELPQNGDVCRSSDCVLDIAALALNQVRPLYGVNLIGRLYAAEREREHASEVQRAVAQAVERIRRNPPPTD